MESTKNVLSYFLFDDNNDLISFVLLSGCIRENKFVYLFDYIYTIKQYRNKKYAQILLRSLKNNDIPIIIICDNNSILHKVCIKSNFIKTKDIAVHEDDMSIYISKL